MKCKAVIFDLGDTLLRYLPEEMQRSWHRAAMECSRSVARYLISRGVPADEERFAVRGPDLLAMSFSPPPEEKLEARLRRLLQHFEITEDSLLPDMLDAFYHPLSTDQALYPAAVETLEALRAGGYRLGLISNSPWGAPGDYGRQDLRRWGLDAFFEVALFSGDVGYRKPGVEIFRMALDQMGLEPHEAIYIGDQWPKDVRAPKSIGMRAIHRRFHDTVYPEHHHGDRDIYDLAEIPRAVSELAERAQP